MACSQPMVSFWGPDAPISGPSFKLVLPSGMFFPSLLWLNSILPSKPGVKSTCSRKAPPASPAGNNFSLDYGLFSLQLRWPHFLNHNWDSGSLSLVQSPFGEQVQRIWQQAHLGIPGVWDHCTSCRLIFLDCTASYCSSEPGACAAAAAANSLQSCLTLCDPIDGSPAGSAIPGILQSRTLEWVVISFSNAWKWKVKVKSLSRVQLLATPWTAAYQAPPSMGFSRQEYWSGVPLPSPGECATRSESGLDDSDPA